MSLTEPAQAEFVTRSSCITCQSENIQQLSSGRFHDEPLNGFLKRDPWGESPLPFLKDANWDFVQCKNCGQKFHRSILTDKWLGIYYSKWMSSESIEEFYDRRKSKFKHEYDKGVHAAERMLAIEKLTRPIRKEEPVRVLDFGCGAGEFLALCADFGFETVGVEFSVAREKTRRVQFFPSLDEVKEDFGTSYFDAVTLFEVLEHLAHPLDILISLNKYVKMNGILILETPNCPNVNDIKSEEDYRLIHPLGHINAFTAKTQELMAQNAGFERIDAPVVQFTADSRRAVKRGIKRIVQPFIKRSTQQMFRKRSEA